MNMKGKISIKLKKAVCVLLCTGITLGNLYIPKEEVKADNETELEDTNVITNGSFEQPGVTGDYQILDQDKIPGWTTTATDGKIEIFRENTEYYKSMYPGENRKLIPIDGTYAAELNANQESTLYQNLNTAENSVYEWGLSHRARSDNDTMALIIGPKQQYNPKKSNVGRDQFMQMVDWELNQITEFQQRYDGKVGTSKKLTLYSRKFANNGTFEGGSSDNFSTTKDDIFSEEWNIWIISSDSSNWQECGYNAYQKTNTQPVVFDGTTQLDYSYTVPKDQTQTTFAFVSVNTKYNNKSYGNFLDKIQFRLSLPFTLNTTKGGTAEVAVPNDVASEDKTVYSLEQQTQQSGMALKNVKLSLKAKAEDDFAFLGAYINDKFIKREEFSKQQEEFSYDYVVIGVTNIRFVFTKKSTIAYETNGGSWPGNGTKEENAQANEADLTTGNFQVVNNRYIYERTEKIPVKDNADFTGWWLVSSGGNETIPKNHTIQYKQPSQNNTSGSFTVTYHDAAGQDKSVEVADTDGLKFIAQWTYRQSIIPESKTLNDNDFKQNTDGGTVSFIIPNQTSDGVSAISDKTGGFIYNAQNNETISVKAEPKDGYYFAGWYDGDTLYSSSQQISYTVMTAGKTWTARFEPSVYYQVLHIMLNEKGQIQATEGENNYIPGRIGETVNALHNSYEGYEACSRYNDKQEIKSGILTKDNTKAHPLQLKLYYKGQEDRLEYDANFADANQSMPMTRGLTFEKVSISQNTFQRTGYTFTGWNTQPNGKGKKYNANDEYLLTVGEDKLYAQWKANTFTLKFAPNLNDGNVSIKDNEGNSVSEKTITYGENYKELPTAASDSGYEFAGWYTQAVGGNVVNSGTICTTTDEVVTLYAHWKKNITIGDQIKVIHSYMPSGETQYHVPDNYPDSITVHLYKKLKGEDDSEYNCFNEKEVKLHLKKGKDENGREIVLSEENYEFNIEAYSDYEYRVGTRLENYDLITTPYKGITQSRDDIDFLLKYHPDYFPAKWRIEYVTSGDKAVPEDKRIIDAANVKVYYATEGGTYQSIPQHETMSVATSMAGNIFGTAQYPVWKYQAEGSGTNHSEESPTQSHTPLYYKIQIESYQIGGAKIKPENSLYTASFDDSTIMHYDQNKQKAVCRNGKSGDDAEMVIRISYRGVPVKFDINNEEADKDSCPKNYDVVPGETINKPANPTAKYYNFEGWYKDKNCTDGQEWDFSTEVTQATTLYAKWTKKEFTHTVLAMTQNGATKQDEENTNGGYVFVSPYDGQPGIPENEQEFPEGKKKEYSSGYQYTREAQKKVKLSMKAEPGYTFDGWYKKSGSVINKIEDGITEDNCYIYEMNSENSTIFARFIPNSNTKYVVRHYKLSKDGKSETVYKEKEYSGITGTKTNAAEEIDIPGYTYASKYDENGKSELLNGIIDGEGQLVLRLYYKPNEDDLFYNANAEDAVGTKKNGKGVTDEKIKVEENKEFTRNGYDFTGWNTKSNGQGTDYRPGDEYQLKDGMDVLYAQWSAKNYNLHFDGNLNGENVNIKDQQNTPVSSKNVAYKAKYGDLPIAQKSGYEFTGWYTKPVGGEKVSKDTIFDKTTDITVYAHWSYEFTLSGAITVDHGTQHDDTMAKEVMVEVYRSDAGKNNYQHVPDLDQKVTLVDKTTGSGTSGQPGNKISEGIYTITVPVEENKSTSDYKYMVLCSVENYNLTYPIVGNKYSGINQTKNNLDFKFAYNPDNCTVPYRVILASDDKTQSKKNQVTQANIKITFNTDENLSNPAEAQEKEDSSFADIIQHLNEPLLFEMNSTNANSYTVWANWINGNPYFYRIRLDSLVVDEKTETVDDDFLWKTEFKKDTTMYYDSGSNSVMTTGGETATQKPMTLELSYIGVPVKFHKNILGSSYAGDNDADVIVDYNYDAKAGSKVKQPESDPEDLNYKFDGWYKDRECTQKWTFEDADEQNVDKVGVAGADLYAKWVPNTYVQLAVAQIHTNSRDADYDSDIPEYEDSLRGGTISVENVSGTHFTKVEGGRLEDYSSGKMAVGKYNTNSVDGKITFIANAQTGYHFKGWYLVDVDENGKEVINKVSSNTDIEIADTKLTVFNNKNRKFIARFDPDEDTGYQVWHIKVNNGVPNEQSAEKETKTGVTGQPASYEPKAPEGEFAGYTYRQDYVAETETFSVKQTVMEHRAYSQKASKAGLSNYILADGSLVIKLYYVADEYKLSFDKNAEDATGSMEDVYTEAYAKETVDKNEFARPGYTFTGWNTNPDGTGTNYEENAEFYLGKDKLNAEQKHVLYAQWKPDEDTIYKVEHYTVNKDGIAVLKDTDILFGTTDMEVDVGDRHKDYPGYEFSPDFSQSGMNTVGKGRIAGDDGLVLKLYYVPKQGGSSLSEDKFTVKYDLAGGKAEDGEHFEDTTVSSGEKIILSGVPIKEGYRFTGWKIKDTDKTVTTGDTLIITENVILKAQWEKNSEPTDPTKPTNPTTPTDPTKPVEPTTPTNPLNPANPTESSESISPAETIKQETLDEQGASAPTVSNQISPYTGDYSYLEFWIMLLGLGLLGIFKRRKCS